MMQLLAVSLGGASAGLDAIGKSMAIIEFEPTGTIKWANDKFCETLGYNLHELTGQHHSMFVEAAIAQSEEYATFWATLARGQFVAQKFKRIAKGGREVWLQASYNPVVSGRGRIIRIINVAIDITEAQLKGDKDARQIAAVDRAQSIIEYSIDGTVVTANDNFLAELGYKFDEVKGRHHCTFVDSSYASSSEYPQFWERLRRGEIVTEEVFWVGKAGKQIWNQAIYNPVFDSYGSVCSVVTVATNVSNRVRAVETLSGSLRKLAAGDYLEEITAPFPPALEKLRIDFNRSASSIRGVMSSVGDIAYSLDAGTQEIVSASNDLARMTEQNAANLAETAAALDQITTTVNKMAAGASVAREVVSTARDDAERGGDVVRRAVEAMSRIEKSSQQIGQIIGVIDEIAFQTNLLALNAGVEAARAGDAGRGFAVVASEVRALAQRSAEAAKEIKCLISASTTQVGEGVKLVGETGKALERIVTKVTEINSVVADIAASAQEQAAGLEQVNTTINEMDQVTQQNAAMAENVTAASLSVAQKTGELANLLGQCGVGGEQADPIRAELKKVAPHAFPQSSTKLTVRNPSLVDRANPRHLNGNLVRVGSNIATAIAREGRCNVTGSADGWEEF